MYLVLNATYIANLLLC